MMKLIITIIKAVFVAYLVIFAVVNSQQVELTFFFGIQPFSMPMFLFAVLVLFIGFLAGIFMMTGEKIGLSRQIKKLEKQLVAAADEINRLKNIPLTENPVSASEENKGGDGNDMAANHNIAIKDALR